MEKAICANPELADLDREINAMNAKVVREATGDNARAGRALQREQDDFVARRNAAFGQPGYDLRRAMKERLDAVCWRLKRGSPAVKLFRLDLAPLPVTMRGKYHCRRAVMAGLVPAIHVLLL